MFLRFTLFIFILLLSFPGYSETKKTEADNPFENIETIFLNNGLKVWYKHNPGYPKVSLGVCIPHGSDRDPKGYEQLAHFTEHMLFADRDGKTEKEIKKEISDLGGNYNGLTYRDRTLYYVNIGRKHGLKALEWIYRIVSPRPMDPKIVEKQREPIKLELRVRKREMADWFRRYYLDIPLLRTPDFWNFEYGMTTKRFRNIYTYKSLKRIDSEKLKWFYHKYYIPSHMTLFISGDIPKETLLNMLKLTFETLPVRAEPEIDEKAVLRKGGNNITYFKHFTNQISYHTYFKFTEIQAEEHLKFIFLSHWFRNRLNDKLRFGKEKSTYGVHSHVSIYRDSGFLSIGGNYKADKHALAKEIIAEEINALRKGTHSESEFTKEKNAIVNELKVKTQPDKGLLNLAMHKFYQLGKHRNFPNLPETFSSYTQENISIFVNRHLTHDKMLNYTSYPNQISRLQKILIAIILFFGIKKLAKKIWLKKIPMDQIRYVAKFKMNFLEQGMFYGKYILIGLILGRLYYYGGMQFSLYIMRYTSHYTLHILFSTVCFIISGLSLFFLLSRIPQKLLIFPDHITIKYWSYRSVSYTWAEVKTLSCNDGYRWTLLPFSFKVISMSIFQINKGITLQLNDGWTYLFQVRDPDEFLNVVSKYRE